MWSLSEASGRRRIDRDALLAAWLERLGPLYADLQAGHFDSLRWADAQITTGATVEVDTGSGSVSGHGRGHGPRERLAAGAHRPGPAPERDRRGRRGALRGGRRNLERV